MKKFKVGDKVLVTAGKDKGKKSEIIKMIPSKDRVVVKGVNMYKKHIKATQDKAGSIASFERALHTASIMLLDADGNPTRVGFKVTKSGKVRYSKKTGKNI